jgi:hypothetical protein
LSFIVPSELQSHNNFGVQVMCMNTSSQNIFYISFLTILFHRFLEQSLYWSKAYIGQSESKSGPAGGRPLHKF